MSDDIDFDSESEEYVEEVVGRNDRQPKVAPRERRAALHPGVHLHDVTDYRVTKKEYERAAHVIEHLLGAKLDAMTSYVQVPVYFADGAEADFETGPTLKRWTMHVPAHSPQAQWEVLHTLKTALNLCGVNNLDTYAYHVPKVPVQKESKHAAMIERQAYTTIVFKTKAAATEYVAQNFKSLPPMIRNLAINHFTSVALNMDHETGEVNRKGYVKSMAFSYNVGWLAALTLGGYGNYLKGHVEAKIYGGWEGARKVRIVVGAIRLGIDKLRGVDNLTEDGIPEYQLFGDKAFDPKDKRPLYLCAKPDAEDKRDHRPNSSEQSRTENLADPMPEFYDPERLQAIAGRDSQGVFIDLHALAIELRQARDRRWDRTQGYGLDRLEEIVRYLDGLTIDRTREITPLNALPAATLPQQEPSTVPKPYIAGRFTGADKQSGAAHVVIASVGIFMRAPDVVELGRLDAAKVKHALDNKLLSSEPKPDLIDRTIDAATERLHRHQKYEIRRPMVDRNGNETFATHPSFLTITSRPEILDGNTFWRVSVFDANNIMLEQHICGKQPRLHGQKRDARIGIPEKDFPGVLLLQDIYEKQPESGSYRRINSLYIGAQGQSVVHIIPKKEHGWQVDSNALVEARTIIPMPSATRVPFYTNTPFPTGNNKVTTLGEIQARDINNTVAHHPVVSQGTTTASHTSRLLRAMYYDHTISIA